MEKSKKSLLKISKDVLQNKFVLYFISVLAIGNLIQFGYVRDITSIALFMVTGVITSFFSENLTVIMIISLLVANMIKNVKEGFKKKAISKAKPKPKPKPKEESSAEKEDEKVVEEVEEEEEEVEEE
jgi:hypothetical protein